MQSVLKVLWNRCIKFILICFQLEEFHLSKESLSYSFTNLLLTLLRDKENKTTKNDIASNLFKNV